MEFSVPQGSTQGAYLFISYASILDEVGPKDLQLNGYAVCLKMNESKTEFIYFSSKQMLKKCNISTVNINGEHIVRSDKVKYLDSFLDSTLSFSQHVIAKCHAANINLQKDKAY